MSATLPGIRSGEHQPEQNGCRICLKGPVVTGDPEIVDPVYLSCGHLLCLSCLDQFQASNTANADKCPECTIRFTSAKPAYGVTGKIQFLIHTHRLFLFFAGCKFSPSFGLSCERALRVKVQGKLVRLKVKWCINVAESFSRSLGKRKVFRQGILMY